MNRSDDRWTLPEILVTGLVAAAALGGGVYGAIGVHQSALFRISAGVMAAFVFGAATLAALGAVAVALAAVRVVAGGSEASGTRAAAADLGGVSRDRRFVRDRVIAVVVATYFLAAIAGALLAFVFARQAFLRGQSPRPYWMAFWWSVIALVLTLAVLAQLTAFLS